MERKGLPLSAPLALGCFLLLLSQFSQALDPTSTNRTGAPVVPAIVVFGDSTVDPGNNNGLHTVAKSNFPPYGQNFMGQKPTGRFSNGEIPSDLIASKLGVKELLPPYLGYDLQPHDILTGVSFASGATGYDPLTPALVNVISMSEQLDLFGEYKERVKAVAGEGGAARIISESLFIVCSGTDDIANTYFGTPFRKTSYDVTSYVNFLISRATSFLKQLHQMGARKIGYIGLPPIGCLPSQRTIAGGILRQCDPLRNQAAQLFNSIIEKEIGRLHKELGLNGSKLVYIDIYSILLDLIDRPSIYGFETSDKGCCGTGETEASVFCNSETSTTCSDVTKYVFWDSYHPTEKAYKIIVDVIYEKYVKYMI
ncbi:GDSL esterase/lipase At3g14820-like [Typha latifolia]|uniref:GDSL esterase/lipase At3g14820-like n=1 Tax=Typha latifolia TaxID=4733 RepID=UPI003C2F0E8D